MQLFPTFTLPLPYMYVTFPRPLPIITGDTRIWPVGINSRHSHINREGFIQDDCASILQHT